MTASTERSADGGTDARTRWRREVAAAQESAMPVGDVAVTCSAPLGVGGLGRHLQEILDALARRDQRASCVCGSTREEAEDVERRRGRRRVAARARLLRGATALPLPLSPALRAWGSAAAFDAYASSRLPAADHLVAFNGQALAQFDVSARERFSSRALVSANSHMRRVVRQHQLARRQYPLEGSWTGHMLARNLREYARADRVLVASNYIRDSFLQEGFPQERISSFPLMPAPRFRPRRSPPASGRFEIVYVGSLAVHKGVPLLIDALRELPHDDLRLTLVGGWGTRGMRRFVQQACAADRRIVAGPGDPLAQLERASLCVHPAYEDGFGYAAAEAMACGVPVIVSEDTGMKELIGSAGAGLVVPTGRREALRDAIDAAYRGELFLDVGS
ncbi:MAG TPA: glycosyltransferase family 4 protein [Solirubrobacteraceae bacterium]|jgi:glycosyltransferase involved in cell wall biosynthesis|nr:glycosyltransferase family 4 protein [Solirubrobacteraceae bacterium]